MLNYVGRFNMIVIPDCEANGISIFIRANNFNRLFLKMGRGIFDFH